MSEYFPVIRELYHLGLYDEIERFISKYDVHIDTKNSNNDDCLAWMCARNHDMRGLRLCAKYGSKEFSYAAAKAMNSSVEESCKVIDWLFDHGGQLWDAYHRSLTWGFIDIHQHILDKYIGQLNLDNVKLALEICGRFGHLEPVKYAIENKVYRDIIDDKTLKECLSNAIYVDARCKGHRYKLIEYLVREKGVTLSEDTMKKIEYLLNNYNPKYLDMCGFEYFNGDGENEDDKGDEKDDEGDEKDEDDKDNVDYEKCLEWERINHIYMPDLFKSSKIVID